MCDDNVSQATEISRGSRSILTDSEVGAQEGEGNALNGDVPVRMAPGGGVTVDSGAGAYGSIVVRPVPVLEYVLMIGFQHPMPPRFSNGSFRLRIGEHHDEVV